MLKAPKINIIQVIKLTNINGLVSLNAFYLFVFLYYININIRKPVLVRLVLVLRQNNLDRSKSYWWQKRFVHLYTYYFILNMFGA